MDNDGETADLIIKALRAEFGSRALGIARRMCADAAPTAQAGWNEIIAIMERDAPSDQTPPSG